MAKKKAAKRPAKGKPVKPAKCKCEADKWIGQQFGATSPSQPTVPKPKPNPTPVKPWAHLAFQSYVELYLAISRLEKLADTQGWPNTNPADRLTDPYGGKAGCPPPPAFP